MPSPSPNKPHAPKFIPTNTSGKTLSRPLPAKHQAQLSQPREKKGEALIDASFTKASLISEEIQQRLLRPGKKDWNLIRNQVWCFGVLADKVLNTLENSEEIKVKLPSQLQDGVKLMVQLQIERTASRPQPMVVSPQSVSADHDSDHISAQEQTQNPNEMPISFIPEQLT